METGDETKEIRAQDGPTADDPPQQERAKEPADRHWRQLAVACLALLVVVNAALAVYAFHHVRTLEQSIRTSLWRSEHRYEALDAQIDFESRRRHLLLGLRDEILETNPSLDWAEAYRYAALAVATAEKYTAFDPSLLVSIGIVESGYEKARRSEAGARGLYQIHPPTGRLLSRSLGWEYNEALLDDPARNTELAGLYLEILFASYDDPTVVLAAYKEGASSAGSFRAGVKDLDSETARYVEEVLQTHERIETRYGTLRPGTGDLAAGPDDAPGDSGAGAAVGASAP